MHWIAASGKDTATATLEKRLWDAADQFRANSGLKSQEYSAPVLGLIFLRFAEVRFAPNAPSWRREWHPLGGVAAWTIPPAITPMASSTCPPKRASTTC
jgi:hypothetical protein